MVRFGDVAQIVTGSTPKAFDENFDGNIPFVTPGDLGEVADIHQAKRSLSELGAASVRTVPKRSVMVCCIGATIGKVGFATRDVATNQQINTLVFDEKIIFPKYAYYYCLTIKSLLVSKSSSTTMPIVNKSNFSDLKMPVPFLGLPSKSLAEQKRIAEILDKADVIRRKRKQAIQLADDFLRAVFLDMFGDPVTNPKGWEVKKLGNVIRLSSGNGLTAKNMDPNGVFPVYGGNGINGKHSDFMFEKPQLTIGRVGVYCGAIHITQPKSWVTDNALYVKEYLQDVNIHYLAQLLEFANLNQYAGKAAQPLVSGSRIHPLEMIFPPLSEQIKFSDIKAIFVKSFCNYCESESTINNLFNSLSQNAFIGEL